MKEKTPALAPTETQAPPTSAPISADAPEWLRVRVRRHVSELIRLAGPVVLSRAGILLISTVDLMMLGRVSTQATAFYAQALIPFITLMVTGIGLMYGTLVASSHAYGRGEFKECGAIWRRSLLWGLLIGLAMTAPGFWAEDFFLLARIEPSLAEGAGRTALILSLGIIPTMLYCTSAFFLESLKRPAWVMVAIYVANGINLVVNFYFIEGGFGFIETPSDGAAMAATIGRFCMGIGLVVFVWFMPDRDQFGVRDKPKGSWWHGSSEQRRYGYASGASYGLETAAFGVMNVFAGWLGIQAAALYGLGMNLTGLMFMLALGLASATSVRVGIAHGRRDWPDRALAGWVGVGVTIIFMLGFAVLLALIPETIIGFYTKDPELVVLAIPVFVLIAWLIVGDGAQICLSNSIRSAADPWSPTYLNFLSFFVVMIPVGYYLAIHLERGVAGLFEGIIIGSLASVVFLGARWIWLCNRAARNPNYM